eukprot:TRINITY_DN20960_c0_g1_i4.p1 TRINITY_DN20960_c0_g1~~TRINITY_DN20960_c0_g1_i4.p1  ORF type:complete len:208 (-),score=44.18 TRINITY_DN20960_c0_g1_i4:12-635(-)
MKIIVLLSLLTLALAHDHDYYFEKYHYRPAFNIPGSCANNKVDLFFAGDIPNCLKAPFDLTELANREHIREVISGLQQTVDIMFGSKEGSVEESCAFATFDTFFVPSASALVASLHTALRENKRSGWYGDLSIARNVRTVMGNHVFCKLSEHKYLVLTDGVQSSQLDPSSPGEWKTSAISNLWEFTKEKGSWGIKNVNNDDISINGK